MFFQVFHVAYVFIKMANSPRPGVWALDRSTDFGNTYTPWQYFAGTINECYQYFGDEGTFVTSIQRDDSVLCSTKYSDVVPLENGEVCTVISRARVPPVQPSTFMVLSHQGKSKSKRKEKEKEQDKSFLLFSHRQKAREVLPKYTVRVRSCEWVWKHKIRIIQHWLVFLWLIPRFPSNALQLRLCPYKTY